MRTKKELCALWKEIDFRAKKSFGQNFLVDSNLKAKILEIAAPVSSDRCLEIGPGFGALTLGLAEKTGSVECVEKDRKIAKVLRERIVAGNSKVVVVEGDILEYNIDSRFTLIIGNLPYSITTPIIEKLMMSARSSRIFIMVQKEYADRMIARPGEEDYSSLSCFVRFRAEVKKHLNLSKECFFPVPKVESVFLELKMRDRSAAKQSS